MANYFLCFILIRVVLPIILCACVLIRQTGLSLIYLLLFFYIPWVYVPTVKSMKGSTGKYLMIMLVFSVSALVSHVGFQIVMYSMRVYGFYLNRCSFLETLLRHIGLVLFENMTWKAWLSYLGPEVIMCITSITLFVICKTLVPEQSKPATISVQTSKRRFPFLVIWGKYVVLVSLCVSAVLQPSIIDGVYFILFLGGITWWACNQILSKTFTVLTYFVIVTSGLHIFTLFIIQMQWIQDLMIKDCKYCRYLDLIPLVVLDCSEPYHVTHKTAAWTSYLKPVFLLWLYYIASLEGRFLVKPLDKMSNFVTFGGISRELSHHKTKKGVKSSKASKRMKRKKKKKKKKGKTAVKKGILKLGTKLDSAKKGDIKRGSREKEGRPLSVFILDRFVSVQQLLYRSSYIGTNIIMMVWSIVYHSWLTFVLLLWACLLWTIQNQRQAMLRCSPFLVFYAECLLIIQYIYCMNLTEKELPEHVESVNLKQIGLSKSQFIHLLLKSLGKVSGQSTSNQTSTPEEISGTHMRNKLS